VTLTFTELRDAITAVAGGLQSLGLAKGECVSVFAENNHRWLIAEQAVMKCGACNAVRGAAAPAAELQYIYDNSQSVGLVIEKLELLTKLMAPAADGTLGIRPHFVVVLY
ncbi:unnamed protein product, partial [Phaeothamnion confervicola]